MYDLPIVNIHRIMKTRYAIWMLYSELNKKKIQNNRAHLSSVKTAGTNVYCIVRSSWVD